MAASPRKIPYQEFDGFLIPQRFSTERFKEAISYVPKSGDVFLGSYPKTGSTWIQYIVFLISTKCINPKSVALMLDMTPYVQRDGLKMIGSDPRHNHVALKYQMPFKFVPYSSKSKYVYIARNPKDTCISFYHFCKSVPGYQFQNGTFNEFFDIFLSGTLPFGDYFENLTSWYEHEGESNFLFLTYEEMKKDLRNSTVEVAKFLGCDLAAEVVDSIENYASLAFMKEYINPQLKKYLSGSPETFNLGDLHDGEDISSTQLTLVRKGEVNQWKSYFDIDHHKRMNQKFKEKTEGTKAQNLWPEVMNYTE